MSMREFFRAEAIAWFEWLKRTFIILGLVTLAGFIAVNAGVILSINFPKYDADAGVIAGHSKPTR